MDAEARNDARAHPWRRFGIVFLPWIAGTGFLAAWTTWAILGAAGEPAVPLDDSYIHFQYAQAFARLSPFEYTPGAAPTPGATSVLWPLLLAPWTALGIEDVGLVWVAWAFGWAALAGLAHETRQLARGLTTEASACVAGAAVLAFGAFAWFAASGMEVVPFAWLMTRAVRRGAEWLEAAAPGRRSSAELIALAVLAPLFRPEGALISLLLAAVFASRRAFRLAPAALCGAATPLGVYYVTTGSAISSTATAKWLPLNPYLGVGELARAVQANVHLLFGTLLDGRLWTSVFIPPGSRWVLWLALPALLVAGWLRGRPGRAALALGLALGALLPATYETFLVNRVRYLWPFASAWLVGAVLVADLTGAALHRWLRGPAAGGPVLGAVLVGLLGTHVPGSVADVAESARAVTRQQVAVGRWIRQHLPEDARVGLNDTGAIAYFGRRRTFDVVGLTTRGEARYWAAGPGSRFEHYERLAAEERPTHFAVYREWFGLEPLLGPVLTERTVHAAILGGATLSAHEARYEALGSAASPLLLDPAGTLLDALDVADLESEAAHDYMLLDASRERNVIVQYGGAVDGARLERHRESFMLSVAPGAALVLRVGAFTPSRLAISAAGRPIALITLQGAAWEEHSLVLPASVPRERVRVEITGAAPFSALHYWVYE
jgi:hypothetical protein